MRRGRWAALVLGLTPALLVVLPPLVWLTVAGVGYQGGHGLPSSEVSLGLLGRSLGIALGTALLGTLLGAGYGSIAARAGSRSRPWLLAGMLGPLFLPPYTAGLALTILLARDGWLRPALEQAGLGGMIPQPDRSPVHVIGLLAGAFWPLAAWLVMSAQLATPRELVEAARMDAASVPALRAATSAGVRRALGSAAVLLFLLALADFGVGLASGLHTYPVLLVDTFQTAGDSAAVARLSLPMLLLAGAATACQNRWLQFPTPGQSEPAGPVSGAPIRAWEAVAAALLPALTFAIPLLVLAAASRPLQTYAMVWGESRDHLANTLITAGPAAILAPLLAFAAGSLWRRRPPQAIDLVCTLGYALPASLVGVAWIRIFSFPDPTGLGDLLYNSAGGLVVLYTGLFFPFAWKLLQPGWGRVPAELVDECLIQGGGWWTVTRMVLWPVQARATVLAILVVGILATRELDATALLRVPGLDTIAFRVQDYLHYAPGPNVAALSVSLVVLNAGIAWVLLRRMPGQWAGDGDGRGRDRGWDRGRDRGRG